MDDVLAFGWALGWIVLWAVYDILMVEYYFKPVNIWAQPGYTRLWSKYLDVYLLATWWILFPVTTYAAFGLSWASVFVAVMFLSGWEDVLYFWLQRKPVPRTIDWLPLTPTSWHLYARAAGGLVVLALVLRPFG